MNNLSNYYIENKDIVNKYMFIIMNIFVLYFYPYLYFISYIIVSYQKLQIDFSITVSNNKLSIDKLVFKNIDEHDSDDSHEEITQINTVFNFDNHEEVTQDIEEEDDDEIVSVINDDDITAIENEMSRVYDTIMNA